MARPQKVGLDYFPLDVNIDQDDKVALIEAQHGILGFGIIIKLLMKIYSEGYFYNWTEKEQILFSRRVNVDINTINAIIEDCSKWGIFSSELLKKYEILTSKGIQVRYFEAAKRRQRVEVIKEYLLLGKSYLKDFDKVVIVDINRVNVSINSQSSEVTETSIPKEKNRKEEYNTFFEEVWGKYPNKKGKGKVSATKKKELYKVGDELFRCIDRYINDVEERRRKSFKDLQYQNGSTFFNSGYVDYLDKNYSAQNDQQERVGVPPSESVLGEREESWF